MPGHALSLLFGPGPPFWRGTKPGAKLASFFHFPQRIKTLELENQIVFSKAICFIYI